MIRDYAFQLSFERNNQPLFVGVLLFKAKGWITARKATYEDNSPSLIAFKGFVKERSASKGQLDFWLFSKRLLGLQV